MLIAVPEDRRVLGDAQVAGAGKEHLVAGPELLDRLAVHLRPQHRPGIVELFRVAVVQHAVRRQIFAEVRHPAADAEREHVVADQSLFNEFHDRGIGQVQHPGVESRRFDMVDAAVRAADEISLRRAFLIEAAALDQIRIDVGEEPDPALAELCDPLL